VTRKSLQTFCTEAVFSLSPWLAEFMDVEPVDTEGWLANGEMPNIWYTVTR
jgi:hypothetical protein